MLGLIVKEISSNAHILELLESLAINPTFNVEDLTLYHCHYEGESYEEKHIDLSAIEHILDDQVVTTPN